MSVQNTPVALIPKIFGECRRAFDSGKTRDIEWRKKQLLQLYKLITEGEKKITDALQKDLHKNALESAIMETSLSASDCANAYNNVEKWASVKKHSAGIAFKMDSVQTVYEPLGVVLIIGPWNYPAQLMLMPLTGAIAAGNSVILKPSEMSPHTSAVITELIGQYMDPEAIKVVNGGVSETTELLKLKYDLVFYTGNGTVGRIVMQAAAKHLTPTILELGGKSPCYVDGNVDLETAALRIVWGKFANNGQTCIAPDYILCSQETQKKLIPFLISALKKYYGEDPKVSPDYGRIINDRQFNRLSGLLKDPNLKEAQIVYGGQMDAKELYISPTILKDISPLSLVMQDEIFGPILPIMCVSSPNEAIDFINSRDKPLALYVYAKSSVTDLFCKQTSSGAVVGNDCLMHAGCEQLPFGGVGGSGTGSYHGKYSFKAFSHKKAMLLRSLGMNSIVQLRAPPYTESNIGWLRYLTEHKPSARSVLKYLGFGMLLTAVVLPFVVG